MGEAHQRIEKRDKVYLGVVVAALLVLILPVTRAASDRHRTNVKMQENNRSLLITGAGIRVPHNALWKIDLFFTSPPTLNILLTCPDT